MAMNAVGNKWLQQSIYASFKHEAWIVRITHRTSSGAAISSPQPELPAPTA
ncbi:hypothetical protein DSM3645_03973 [Blastopirellula marina DSM 3645]|uniref:Uncharacterized protein n=1 Tax=Blastopirellula marina DSM 3645 TaxID=314230 RepID=A3ZV36_9BACT|nr:hypothetical protein DSM3645_03973 [Blastopirellula marina DSM 3645]